MLAEFVAAVPPAPSPCCRLHRSRVQHPSKSGFGATTAVARSPGGAQERLKCAPPTALGAPVAHRKRPEGRALRYECSASTEMQSTLDGRFMRPSVLHSIMIAKRGG